MTTHQEVAAAAGRMKWQPIETAPRDGTQVLLFGTQTGHTVVEVWHNSIAVGEWIEYDEASERELYGVPGIWGVSPDRQMEDPTHWMPLPDPPTEEEAV